MSIGVGSCPFKSRSSGFSSSQLSSWGIHGQGDALSSTYWEYDSVCDTVVYKKPKDQSLLSLLREFLHIVVTKKFYPVVRKIGTKENVLADFISRRFDPEAAAAIFDKFGLHEMVLVKPKTDFFKLSAPW